MLRGIVRRSVKRGRGENGCECNDGGRVKLTCSTHITLGMVWEGVVGRSLVCIVDARVYNGKWSGDQGMEPRRSSSNVLAARIALVN